ncbi:hypothetical protein GRF29_28g684466 [Pseudopithomyces chartarum]|uniref:Haloacid dehalogenase n=1 Tax=Pseudopithomyces chartarum TaxID=1892770 RepID=A0AAN6RJ66_9PLEO|nr:hypothetical protein GRF29_28g684466 [Pseudopithomyces chartarum]
MSSPSPLPKPKAIVFDLLTGLLDSWTVWDASTPSKTSAEGRKWRQQYLAITYGSTTYGPGSTYEELVTRAAIESGMPPSAPEALLRHWGDLKAWPEVGPVLRELRAKGYLLGVITNCSKDKGSAAVRNAEKSAEEAGNEEEESWRFDAAITAEEIGWYKPALEAYHAVLPLLGDGGVRPEEVLFVAGSAGDVQGASKAGFKVVWNNHVGLERKGDAIPLKEGRTLSDVLEDFL